MARCCDCDNRALIVLTFISLVYFFESYDRYLLSVSVIPYIDYTSYDYSLLSGTLFALFYSCGGLILALYGESSPTITPNSFRSALTLKIGVLTAACLIFSVAFGLSGLATNFTEQACIRMVMGLSQSLVTPFSIAIIGSCFPDSQKGKAFGIFQLGVYFSFSLSLSLGTYMYDEYGWQSGYILFGLIGIVLSLFVPCLLPLIPRENPNHRHHGPTHGTAYTKLNIASIEDTEQLDSTRHNSVSSAREDVKGPGVSHSNNSTRNTRSSSISDGDGDADADAALTLPFALGHAAPSHEQLNNNTEISNRSSSQAPHSAPSRGHGDESELARGDNDDLERGRIFPPPPPSVPLAGSGALGRMLTLLARVLRLWNTQPIIYLLAVSTGVRLGGGYIWSSYTSVFFSELLVREMSGQGATTSCSYSFNSSVLPSPTPSPTPSLSALRTLDPRPSKEMHDKYYDFLAGGGAGMREGGVAGAEVPRAPAGTTPTTEGNGSGIHSNPSVCGERYPLCAASGPSGRLACAAVSLHPWHNQGMAHVRLEQFLSWVPLAGSALGNVLGGFVSDRAVAYMGWRGRAIVPAVGNAIALPFVALALVSPFPGCFLYMIASGLVGEVYLGQSLALLTDLTPSDLQVTCVALFMFVTTMIAGNMPLLVPAVSDLVVRGLASVCLSVVAAPVWGSPLAGEGGGGGDGTRTVDLEVCLGAGGADSLQGALLWVLCCIYGASAVLYTACYLAFGSLTSPHTRSSSSSSTTMSPLAALDVLGDGSVHGELVDK